jgi:hypothetical protein
VNTVTKLGISVLATIITGCANNTVNTASSSCPEVSLPSFAEIDKMSTSTIRVKLRTAEVESQIYIYGSTLDNKRCMGSGVFVNAWRDILLDRLKDENAGLRPRS